jgi:sec-independent protein translocase protein TatA
MELGWPEILLILVIVLIVFGVGKLPQVGGAIGKGIREFRKAQHGGYDNEEPVSKQSINQVKQGELPPKTFSERTSNSSST